MCYSASNRGEVLECLVVSYIHLVFPSTFYLVTPELPSGTEVAGCRCDAHAGHAGTFVSDGPSGALVTRSSFLG